MAAIEALDPFLPRLAALKPDVLVVTSDHSTPALLKGHSGPEPTWTSPSRCRLHSPPGDARSAIPLGPIFAADDDPIPYADTGATPSPLFG